MKRIDKRIKLIHATINDYRTIQNMARFYVYEMSRYCADIPGWEMPDNGLYESFDFKIYFTDEHRKAFLIKVDQEIAGFVLLNREGLYNDSDWNIGEFFILAKFQKRGIGKKVAYEIWDMLPGTWEVSVMPANKGALLFWQDTIETYTQGKYKKQNKFVSFDKEQPERVVYCFKSC